MEGDETEESAGFVTRLGKGGGDEEGSLSVRESAPGMLPGSVSSLSGHINSFLAPKLAKATELSGIYQISGSVSISCHPETIQISLESLTLCTPQLQKNSDFLKPLAPIGYSSSVPFFHLTVETTENNAEFLSESLYAYGALGQEWREPHLLTMPGIDAPPPGKIHIVSFFETLQAAKTALQAAQNQWNAQLVALALQEDTDWSTAWRKQICATETRHLWVGPPWLEPSPGKQALYIEPKMAFGTGDHPTTRLCLEEIDAFCSAFPKATVLDVGTGTGILGMAACKLGALHALGTDNDSIALVHARENIELNHIDNMRVSDAELHHIHERFELIVANIFANALMDLAEALCKKTQKCLVLSGILGPQSAELEMRFLGLGMQLSAKREFGEWVCLSLKPPEF